LPSTAEQVRECAIKAADDRLRELDEIFNREYNFDDYARKLFLIENCIFGIDRQSIAVQIAKLRFFISLVIDQKENHKLPNFGIRALPNLKTKFVAANTLIGIERPSQLSFAQKAVMELEKQLKEVRHQYFTADMRSKKRKLQQDYKKIRKRIAEELYFIRFLFDIFGRIGILGS
jgi:ribosomal protein L29